MVVEDPSGLVLLVGERARANTLGSLETRRYLHVSPVNSGLGPLSCENYVGLHRQTAFGATLGSRQNTTDSRGVGGGGVSRPARVQAFHSLSTNTAIFPNTIWDVCCD